MHGETKVRSIVKTITWRLCATTTTFLVAFFITRDATIGLEIAGIEAVIKLLIYFFHERGWERIQWGKKEVRPFVVWITGYSGSGKTVTAKRVTELLVEKGIKADHLDGETIRDLFPRTGFDKASVIEHIERVGLLASRLEKRGVCVIASFISPYRESRDFVRNLCDNFIEVHLNTPLDVCKKRDSKNLYVRAEAGEIKNLPGVDVEYELTDQPELTLDNSAEDENKSAKKIINYLKKHW